MKKPIEVGLVVAAAPNEAALVQALKDFVAFTIESYRDGMADVVPNTPEEFVGMAAEVWLDMIEDKKKKEDE